MSYIVLIQSHIRRYLQRKKYICIYNAAYTIQCFILHRIDVSILLENIRYLAKFSKSKDKVQFLQKKTDTHKQKIKKISILIKKPFNYYSQLYIFINQTYITYIQRYIHINKKKKNIKISYKKKKI